MTHISLTLNLALLYLQGHLLVRAQTPKSNISQPYPGSSHVPDLATSARDTTYVYGVSLLVVVCVGLAALGVMFLVHAMEKAGTSLPEYSTVILMRKDDAVLLVDDSAIGNWGGDQRPTANKATDIARSLVSVLNRGVLLKQHCNGISVRVVLGIQGNVLHWADFFLDVGAIVSVQSGMRKIHDSAGQWDVTAPENFCFTIHTPRETYHFEASSTVERDAFVNGLQLLISQHVETIE